jgi:phosphoribosylaminoimidazolecarboxamide formyltransferase/IMP cyclohydrolase
MSIKIKIKRALVSVSDKTGLAELCLALQQQYGIEILSTGGTAKALRDAGIVVIEVSEYTGFPECFGGRLKTLHPLVHGGLLSRYGNASDAEEAASLGIKETDLLVVNLYPFEATVAKPGVTVAEAIEQIDIGGPGMLRSASKGSNRVTAVCSPSDYPGLLEEMRTHNGCTTELYRFRLGTKVFELTSAYDAAIAAYRRKVAGPL